MMLCPYKDEKDETYSGFCEQVLKRDALELLKILDSALEFLTDSGFDTPCDVLISDDGWCDEHCTLHGQTKDCWLRYFSQISKEGKQE